jgi:phosphonate transport system ATP-binding protein
MIRPVEPHVPAVQATGLAKRYGRLVALSDIDLTVLPGERVAVAGPSGSGKTTLLYLLAGLIQPDGGSLSLVGRDLAKIGPGRELSELVGIIHQQFNLVPHLPVVHNVLAGRLGQWGILRSIFSLVSSQDREMAGNALEQLGIHDKINERTSRLSGGEQQRVAIARLMLQNPRIVLADEPVSSLDPARANEILQILTGLAGDSGGTLVASLHAPELIRKYFTRVIGLREGVLQFDLPADQLNGQVLEALYDLDRNGSNEVESPVF